MLAQAPQGSAFMQGDVTGFIAFDFVLRLIFAGVMDVTLVIHVFSVNAHDLTANPAGFRIPTHAIADFEPLAHSKPAQTEK
jgi:hypothetical protein